AISVRKTPEDRNRMIKRGRSPMEQLPNRRSVLPSLDGGVTWLPSVRVSTHANLREEGDSRFNGGGTSGLAADADGVFHPVWIDNRAGIHQMWTATVTVREQPSRISR